MKKQMAILIGIAVFLLAGCAASGPKLASSAGDIVGSWQSTNTSAEIQFNEDRTVGLQFDSGANYSSEFWFEGTQFFINVSFGNECANLESEHGIYEVELLENGNLQFTVIEDECAERANTMAGGLIVAEWEPVP